MKCLVSTVERISRIHQIRDSSNKDSESWSLLTTLKMFWKKKGKGTPKQKLWVIVQVKFMSPLVVCLSNSCLNTYVEGTLSKGINSVHTGFDYVMELK